MRACHRHGQGKRLTESDAFFWPRVPLPFPSNKPFIFTLPPLLFRSGFRQVRCFGRQRPLFSSHSRLWLWLRIAWRFSRLAYFKKFSCFFFFFFWGACFFFLSSISNY